MGDVAPPLPQAAGCGYNDHANVPTKGDAVEVGIRALRDRLSEYVERVRQGEEVIVTDRGRAVARLVPIGHERTLERLVREGLVERAPAAGERRRPRRVTATGPVTVDRR